MASNPVSRNPELQFKTEKNDSESTVCATGRIVNATSPALDKTMRELVAEGKRIVLDLTNVNFVDSSGLGALVSIYMHAGRAKCGLKIANPKERIRDLFKRSGLAPVFEGDSFDALWEAWSHTTKARD